MTAESRMPFIEKYAFGSMRVASKSYYSDIVITAAGIKEWWREESHLVQPDDVALILEKPPAVLIIGTGYSGNMRVSDEVSKLFEEKGVELVVERTAAAVDAYNKTVREAKKTVSAAFHLTC